MEKTIVFMFLGGVPNTPNIITHWKNMNVVFSSIENVFVVVHPVIFDEEFYEKNVSFLSLFKRENVFIVDKSHHVDTMWGTLSLVDAELLMMQYAHRCKKDDLFYDKYILLSSMCCPLYRIDVIYKDILSDNKSIIGIFQTDYLAQSQWMILDKVHVKLLFVKDHLKDTYFANRSWETNECHAYGKKKILSRLRIPLSGDSGINEFYEDFGICDASDEYFFVKLIQSRFSLSEIRMISKEEIIKNIMSIPIPILDLLEEITEKSETIHIDPITTGEVNCVFYKWKKYKIMMELYDLGSIHPTSVIGITTFTGYNPDNVFRNFNLFEDFDPSFIYSDKTPVELQEYILDKINPNPSPKTCEFLRKKKLMSARKDIFTEDYMMSTTTHPIEYSSFTLRTILNSCILLLTISCMFDNNAGYGGNGVWIISSKKIDVIRTILIVYLKIIVKEFGLKKFDSILKKFQSYIEMFQNKFNPIISELNENFVSELDEVYKGMDPEILDKLLSKKFGTVITNNILLGALATQSYFIRKCYDTCEIEHFSEILRDLEMITTYPQVKEEPGVIIRIEPYNFREIDRSLEKHDITQPASNPEITRKNKKSITKKTKKSMKKSMKKSTMKKTKKSMKKK